VDYNQLQSDMLNSGKFYCYKYPYHLTDEIQDGIFTYSHTDAQIHSQGQVCTADKEQFIVATRTASIVSCLVVWRLGKLVTGQGGKGQGWGIGHYQYYQAEGQVVKSTDLTSLGFAAILLHYINEYM